MKASVCQPQQRRIGGFDVGGCLQIMGSPELPTILFIAAGNAEVLHGLDQDQGPGRHRKGRE